MKTTMTVLTLSLTLMLGPAAAARADFILQPASASTNMGSAFSTSPDRTRNQSGLSAGYTSLATDFDAYLLSNPTHGSFDINSWIANSATGNFDFDLGGTFTIESFALWNLGANRDSNVRGFTLLADDNAAFSSPTLLGSFNANPNTGPVASVGAEVFTFSPTSAAFVRMSIDNTPFARAGFGEAAFEVQPSAVPEPSGIVLAAAGAMSLLGAGLRRREKGSGVESDRGPRQPK